MWKEISVEYQKEIQSKVGFSRTRKTHHPEKESDYLIFHCKIEQTLKKEKLMKSFMEELYSENL